MIYSVDGTPSNIAYSVSGDSLSQAYDIDQNPLLGETLVVMTYNYQWCTKINSQLTMQQAIINKYKPDIIGLQEAASNNKNSNTFPSLVDQFLSGYTKQLSTQATNRNAIAYKLPVSDYQTIKYTQNDDENWDYQKCRITLPSGKVIAWYNTHLTWRHNAETYLRKYNQAAEMFADITNERQTTPYIIVTGDFNMYGLSFDSDDYIGVGKQFADAGFILANWNSSVGFVKTYSGLSSATSLSEFSLSCDNIICTPNIQMTSVTFDTTKLGFLNGDPIDHVPVIATLHFGG